MKEPVTLRRAIENRYNALDSLIVKKKSDLESAPEGSLRSTHSCGKVRYYHYLPNQTKSGIYIPANQHDKIRALAQKQYDTAILASAEKEIKLLKNYLLKVPAVPIEGIFEGMPEERQKLVVPITEPDDVFLQRWKSQPYPNIAARKEHPVILNDRGMELDSKAELTITNQFDKRGIAFLPQFPVYLKGWGWVYSDFKVLNLRTRQEYYWEHLGMLDSPAYRKHNLPKLNSYILNGYIPGQNLILSWESDESKLDMRVIDALIDSFLI